MHACWLIRFSNECTQKQLYIDILQISSDILYLVFTLSLSFSFLTFLFLSLFSLAAREELSSVFQEPVRIEDSARLLLTKLVNFSHQGIRKGMSSQICAGLNSGRSDRLGENDVSFLMEGLGFRVLGWRIEKKYIF